MSLVYIVGNTPSGARAWFVALDSRLDKYKRPVQFPTFDDTNAKQVSLEFALDARERWRKDFGINVQITLEKYGPPFDEKDSAPLLTERLAEHRVQFVALTGGGVDGKGYFVRFSPERNQFYCRVIDIPSMVAEHRDRETLWADKPEDVANKIIELWTIKIAVPFDDPAAIARAEAERQREQVTQQNKFIPGLRPGCR